MGGGRRIGKFPTIKLDDLPVERWVELDVVAEGGGRIVENAEPAAQGGLWVELIGYADTRRQVVPIRLDNIA